MEVESILEASKSYEAWLGKFVKIVEGDLKIKHQHMAESPFMFLRATFYRWMQHWSTTLSDLSQTEHVLAVGDLHIENFGTWRDQDGRLIWGVNDFDETYSLSYTIDLVRLATSAWIASRTRAGAGAGAGAFKINRDDALEAILDGYERGLRKGGCPFVLEEHHIWLRDIAVNELRDPERFWEKVSKLQLSKNPGAAKAVLLRSIPSRQSIQFMNRTAGLGSLGRPRIVAVSDWGGSVVCREAKALAPSACIWAAERTGSRKLTSPRAAMKLVQIENLLKVARRVPDPFYHIDSGWIVRRLAPHCSKIDMSHLPKKRDDLALLSAMGLEIANLHLGSPNRRRVIDDFGKLRRRQIRSAVETMTDLTLDDWQVWREANLI